MPYHISGSSLRRHVFFWVGVVVVCALFLWFFRSILLPFVAGMRSPISLIRWPTGWSAGG